MTKHHPEKAQSFLSNSPLGILGTPAQTAGSRTQTIESAMWNPAVEPSCHQPALGFFFFFFFFAVFLKF